MIESALLPGGVRLKATTELSHESPDWRKSHLRRSLRFSVMVGVSLFAAAVMLSAYTLGSAIAPFTSVYERTKGTVTGLVHIDSRADRQCRQTFEFTVAGRQVQGTSHDPVECATAQPNGTVLQISFDPHAPADIHVVDSRAGTGSWPWLTGSLAILFIALAAGCLTKTAIPYRRLRRLVAKGPDWLELTAVTKGRTRAGDWTSLLLEAEDAAGQPRDFLIRYRGQNPWRPIPRAGERLHFAMATDGTGWALLSKDADPGLWLVQLHVPNTFELRAMGA